MCDCLSKTQNEEGKGIKEQGCCGQHIRKLCAVASSMLAGRCCPEALSVQVCIAGIGETISPSGQGNFCTTYNRAVHLLPLIFLSCSSCRGGRGGQGRGFCKCWDKISNKAVTSSATVIPYSLMSRGSTCR